MQDANRVSMPDPNRVSMPDPTDFNGISIYLNTVFKQLICASSTD